MASRIIAQLIVQGASIFSKAFVSAYHEALKNARGGAAAAGAASARASGRLRMRTDEAMKILSIEPHELSRKAVLESKVFRSKEALDAELDLREAEEEQAKVKQDEQPPHQEKEKN
eukprot:scaffold1244_cov162-Ochromonas_danica.AAC.22